MTEKAGPVILSFDVEEHHRIEAATGLTIPPATQSEYAARMESTTRGILDQLARSGVQATFFLVGELARTHRQLIVDIAQAGHEIAAHGWDHRRVHHFTPLQFRDDIRRSKEELEQVSGQAVVGYRAPTFSVMRDTAWAIDQLADVGYRYDSSVFPVRHDRYGVPAAPRTPFVISGYERSLLELPPVTYRMMGQNLPVAGGGYFRLFPLVFLTAGVRQLAQQEPALGMLYFHPWEFDPGQPKLPLRRLSRFRTYVGIRRSTARLDWLITRYHGRFRRAIDVVATLALRRETLPQFCLADGVTPCPSPSGVPAARPSTAP